MAKEKNLPILSTCQTYNRSLQWEDIFSGHKTHFLVECPSKPIDVFNVLPATNGGGVCMPYFGYQVNKFHFHYNGDGINGHGYPFQWNDKNQCLAKDCITLASKADCDANPDLQPCVCYDTCPLGQTYFPLFDEFGTNSQQLNS